MKILPFFLHLGMNHLSLILVEQLFTPIQAIGSLLLFAVLLAIQYSLLRYTFNVKKTAENQDEIIRLLKKIAGEQDDE